ncbi:hypothetical protein B0T39_07745 [Chromobacterium haemolyticum]|nr:hypothetical protein B0T39_07745 [Chromobacterium haemolyticum]
MLAWLGVVFVLVLPNLKAEPVPSPETHVRCPECRELVRMDARRCKHCHAALTPLAEAGKETLKQRPEEQDARLNAIRDAIRAGQTAEAERLLAQPLRPEQYRSALEFADLYQSESIKKLLAEKISA